MSYNNLTQMFTDAAFKWGVTFFRQLTLAARYLDEQELGAAQGALDNALMVKAIDADEYAFWKREGVSDEQETE